MAARPALTDPDRPRLVGVKPVDPANKLSAGAHFIPHGAAAETANDQGWVASVAYSPSLGCWVGLGLLTRGPDRHGEIVTAADPLRGRNVAVEVCSPVFVDPEGARLRV
jgi:sarcosine oxidase subunit alpha